MSQDEVLNVLDKSKKPLTRSQIAQELNKEPTIISREIRMLLKFKEIKCIEIDRFMAGKFLGKDCAFRRMRLYYTNKCCEKYLDGI